MSGPRGSDVKMCPRAHLEGIQSITSRLEARRSLSTRLENAASSPLNDRESQASRSEVAGQLRRQLSPGHGGRGCTAVDRCGGAGRAVSIGRCCWQDRRLWDFWSRAAKSTTPEYASQRSSMRPRPASACCIGGGSASPVRRSSFRCQRWGNVTASPKARRETGKAVSCRGWGNLSGNISPTSARSLAKIVGREWSTASRRTAAARALASAGAESKLSPPPMPSATASATAWSPGMYLKRPTCVKKKWCQSGGRVSILWRGLTDGTRDRRGALGIILGTVRADGARWRKMV